jgi:hypothetical protein
MPGPEGIAPMRPRQHSAALLDGSGSSVDEVVRLVRERVAQVGENTPTSGACRGETA